MKNIKIKICRIVFYIIAGLSVKILLNFILVYCFNNNLSNPVVDKLDNLFLVIFFSILVAPLFETLVFFHLPFLLINYLRRRQILKSYRFISFILLSCFLFSLNHLFSLTYFVFAFLGGMIYSYIYIRAYIMRVNPFITTLILHILYNLIVFLINTNWK